MVSERRGASGEQRSGERGSVAGRLVNSLTTWRWRMSGPRVPSRYRKTAARLAMYAAAMSPSECEMKETLTLERNMKNRQRKQLESLLRQDYRGRRGGGSVTGKRMADQRASWDVLLRYTPLPPPRVPRPTAAAADAAAAMMVAAAANNNNNRTRPVLQRDSCLSCVSGCKAMEGKYA